MTLRALFPLFLVVAAASLCLPFVAGAQPATPPVRPPEAQPAKPPTEPPPDAATEADDTEVVQESRNWLALIDADKAGQAWDGAGAQLKASVSRAKWIEGIRGIRKPFGKFVSRETVQVARTHALPGVPEGDYAIVQFDAVYAGGRHATELVIWTLNDTSWRVSGYQIR